MVGHRKAFFVGVMLLLLTLLASCGKQTPETAVVDSVSAPTDYTQLVTSTIVVEQGALRPSIETSGVVQGRDEVQVIARTAGIVRSIDFELGQRVEQGQRLVMLDDTIPRLSASQIERQAENARKELEVQIQLYERGAISLSSLNQSKATLDGLEAQLERARETLRDTTITAPINGSVADQGTSLVVGETVQVGQTIARIIDLENLRMTLSLGQSQVFLVEEGADATIEIVTPTEVIKTQGVVRAISSGSDARTGSWTVLVDFDNPRPDLIRSGISANATITNVRAPIHPLVPNAAMVNREGSTYVYVKQENTANLVEVRVLDRYGDRLAIEPVDETFELVGAEVLTSGLSRIDEGSSVVTQYQ